MKNAPCKASCTGRLIAALGYRLIFQLMALPFTGSALHYFLNFLANLVAKTDAQAVC